MNRMVGLVLHYRTPARTAACLESLVAAGCRELIVIDNSGDQGVSVTAMSEHMTEIRAGGCVLDVVDAGRNLGFAAGVNLGLRQARATGPARIALVNSDAELSAGAFARASELLAAGAELVVPNEEGQPAVSPKYYARFLGLVLPFAGPGMVRMCSGAVLFLSERLAATDLFDEAFFFYGEDVELAGRLARSGGRIIFARDVLFRHAGAVSAVRGSLFYEYHIVRGHWLLAMRLNNRAWERLLAVVGRSIFLPARAGLRSLRSRRLTPLTGLALATWDLIIGRPRNLAPGQAPIPPLPPEDALGAE